MRNLIFVGLSFAFATYGFTGEGEWSSFSSMENDLKIGTETVGARLVVKRFPERSNFAVWTNNLGQDGAAATEKDWIITVELTVGKTFPNLANAYNKDITRFTSLSVIGFSEGKNPGGGSFIGMLLWEASPSEHLIVYPYIYNKSQKENYLDWFREPGGEGYALTEGSTYRLTYKYNGTGDRRCRLLVERRIMDEWNLEGDIISAPYKGETFAVGHFSFNSFNYPEEGYSPGMVLHRLSTSPVDLQTRRTVPDKVVAEAAWFKDNRRGAFTFQFDDGSEAYYNSAFELMKKSGLVGDLAIFESLGGLSLENFREMVAAGWGVTHHLQTGAVSTKELAEKLITERKILREKSGKTDLEQLTFLAHANRDSTKISLIAKEYAFADIWIHRHFNLRKLNSAFIPEDANDLRWRSRSRTMMDKNRPDNNYKRLMDLATLNSRSYANTVYHHVKSYFVDEVAAAKKRSDAGVLWVTTFAGAMKYIQKRSRVIISDWKMANNRLAFSLTNNLKTKWYDKSTEKITIAVYLSGKKVASVTEDGKSIEFTMAPDGSDVCVFDSDCENRKVEILFK